MDERTIARFWSKVDKSAGPDGCWLWTASKMWNGYGQFNSGLSVGRGMLKAHRVSWELAHGPIPAGDHHGTMCVCHRCDVRHCVNPAHLFIGTQSENIRDMDAKARRVNMRGDMHGMAKLTEAQSREIIGLLSTGMRHRIIASLFGVSRETVSAIASGKKWAHLPR